MNLKQLLLFGLLCTGSVLGFYACDNDDDESSDVANVEFRFNFTVDGQEFKANDVYNINGTDVSFEIAQFYVSGITFTPATGDAVSVDKHVLVTPTSANQAVTELTKGSYDMVTFDIGVQAEANDQTEDDFTSRSGDDPLAIQNPSMHWNWSAGYKFIRLDGVADVDGDGTLETPIAYHLGTVNFLTSVSNQLSTAIESGNTEIQFNVDLAKMFTGFDFKVEEDQDTHTANNIPLAERFSTNLATAITVQ